ncbi:MAG: sensor domain-containing diguanylate cyclase [Acholeplasmatales bacterium]|nr:MAG: sensor domain-containing diguanylate cyclase [Acholeplasmatales bacterium]
MMKRDRLSFLVSTRPMFTMIGLFFMLFTVYAFYREWVTYRNDLEYFEATLFDEAKERLKIDIENRVEEFDYMISGLEQNLYDQMQNQLGLLLIDYTYHQDVSMLPPDSLAHYLHHIVTVPGRPLMGEVYTSTGLHLQYETDTVVFLPRAEAPSVFGEEAVSTALEHPDQLLKTSVDGISYLLTGKVVDDYTVLLGVNFTEYQARALNDIANRFFAYYEDREDYIFLIDRAGNILLHPDEAAMGLNIFDDLEGTHFESAFKQILEGLDQQEQTFLEYVFYDDTARLSASHRIAYVYEYEPLQIVIGKSVSEQHFAPVLEAFRQRSLHSFVQFTLPFYILLISAAIGAGFAIHHYTKQSEKLLIEEDALHRKIASLSNQLILITDTQDKILFMNALGDTVLGRFDKIHQSKLDTYLIEKGERYYLYGQTKRYVVRTKKEPITYQREKAYLWFIEDITEETKIADTLLEESNTDLLTKLPNRRRLIKDFQTLFATSKQQFPKQDGALGIIDLDRFKRINDLNGHEYGDQVLQEIAQIFLAESHPACTFYRLGGDEFAVLSTQDKKSLVKTLESIRSVLSTKQFKGLTLSFTYGIAVISTDESGQNFGAYYSRADQTLYSFKQSNKSST